MAEIVIIGAHTAVGQALGEALEDRGLEGRAARATTTEHVGPGLVLIEPDLLSGARIVLSCFDDPVVRSLAEHAGRLKAALVDVAGVLGPDEAPLVAPLLGRRTEPPPPGASRLAVGPLGPLASVLEALAPFGLRAVRAVSLESAAGRGQPGIEELSAQTQAVFTGRDAPLEVLGAPLAFGIHGATGEGDADALARDLGALLGAAAPASLSVARTRVSSFTGEGISFAALLDDPPEVEAAADRIGAARGLRLVDRPIRSLEAVERDDALVGELRLRGPWLDLFVAYDRLRAGAAAAAALLAEAALGEA